MEQIYDREAELKAFDDTKAGVKGLVDAGITQLPRIFIRPPESLEQTPGPGHHQFHFPIIDLQGLGEDGIKHREIVDKIRQASETQGFFQIVNHGVEPRVTYGMINGVQRFFDQDVEVKKKWYSRDPSKSVRYMSNLYLYTAPTVTWKDSIGFSMLPRPPKPEEIPDVCRDIVIEYSDEVMKLGSRLSSIFSEALGLNPEYLKNSYDETFLAQCHYSPACPEPEKTLGTNKHRDGVLFTVLLQDHIGGLQVLHHNHWVDVPPTPAALVVNIGNLLQFVSNDKFVSIDHRVLANRLGPRISVASFFNALPRPPSAIYEPIKELLSEEYPPKYRPITRQEFTQLHVQSSRGDGTTPPLLQFKLTN